MICYHCMREHKGPVCPYCGFNPQTYEPVPTALVPSTKLQNRYLLGCVLGKGGFGITYVGIDTTTGSKVAIKEYFPSSIAFRDGHKGTMLTVQGNMRQVYENGVRKFYNEAMILSRLQNIPNIVNIYDFFQENNTAYIVMEYIDGTAIDQIVMNQGPLDIDVVLTIYFPIIEALAAVHDAGLLHRDISPSNVMLDNHFKPRLIDFGSSRAYSHEMSSDMTVFLKNGFAPIEQYTRKGKHRPTEDVYAICASMYYTLTGKIPPAAPDRISFDTLRPLSQFLVDIPDKLADVILKGMALRQEDRYPDMRALAQAIMDSLGENTPDESHVEETEHMPPEKGGKHKGENGTGNGQLPIWLPVLAGVFCVALLVILFVLLLGGNP